MKRSPFTSDAQDTTLTLTANSGEMAPSILPGFCDIITLITLNPARELLSCLIQTKCQLAGDRFAPVTSCKVLQRKKKKKTERAEKSFVFHQQLADSEIQKKNVFLSLRQLSSENTKDCPESWFSANLAPPAHVE